MRHIKVKYQNNDYDIVPDLMLNELISWKKIRQFYRSSEGRWVTVGSDPIRGIGGSYPGPERRMEDFHKIRSSLAEQAEYGAEIDGIRAELQREVRKRQRIEQEFHKIRTALREQSAERVAEMDRIKAERQREVQEWKQILDSLRARLTNSKFESLNKIENSWGSTMKDGECVQEKYHLVVNLVSQLREMQEHLNELEKIKGEYEIEKSQRIVIEEDFHKTRTSLEEQLTERGAEIDRITSELQREVGERQRIEQEFHNIRTSLEEQLAARVAEMDRITAERQHEVQEWKQILDSLRDRLTNSKF